MDNYELKRFILEIIEEEFSPKACEIAAKWHDGSLVLKAGNDGQDKEIPIEVFFKKILTVRDSLRVLEQKLNTSKSISQEEKVNFQAYITKAYGSLTTFNVLFKDGRDRFYGAGGAGGKAPSTDKGEKMTVTEAKKKIGLNVYD